MLLRRDYTLHMKKQKYLAPGKLPSDFLSLMIKKYASGDRSIITGPGIGEDAAVINFAGKNLIAKTDPVTFAGKHIGYYAVNINANDIAAMGGTPRWFLACLLIPENAFTKKKVKEIFSEVSSACKELGVSLCGGHTEITSAVGRPVISGCMLGEASAGATTPSGAASPGDDILLTKRLAIEGAAIIAAEKPGLLNRVFSKKELAVIGNMIFSPGISIVKEALLAVRMEGVKAMHDLTEGGLSQGLWEVAEASGTGALIESESVPVLGECARICSILGIDPLGLISSGSLLLYCRPGRSDDIMEKMRKSRIECSKIGVVTGGTRVFLESGGRKALMPRFPADEITKVLR